MLPKYLYKVFDEKQYADDFLNNGRIRFSTLYYYKTHEDEDRVDPTEGHGGGSKEGEALVIDLAKETMTPEAGIEELYVEGGEDSSFILCTSAPKSEKLQDLPIKFGKYVVRIKDPARLFKEIESAMRNDKALEKNRPQLEGALIRYDKDENLDELTDQKIKALGWAQKPAKYWDEFEYRFRFKIIEELIGSPEHYFISIGGKLSYCELITRMGISPTGSEN